MVCVGNKLFWRGVDFEVPRSHGMLSGGNDGDGERSLTRELRIRGGICT
jgi:hypothetical protein